MLEKGTCGLFQKTLVTESGSRNEATELVAQAHVSAVHKIAFLPDLFFLGFSSVPGFPLKMLSSSLEFFSRYRRAVGKRGATMLCSLGGRRDKKTTKSRAENDEVFLTCS